MPYATDYPPLAVTFLSGRNCDFYSSNSVYARRRYAVCTGSPNARCAVSGIRSSARDKPARRFTAAPAYHQPESELPIMATSKTMLSLAAGASIALAAVGTARAETGYYQDIHSIVNQIRGSDGSLSCMATVGTPTSGGLAHFSFSYGYTAAGYGEPGYFSYAEDGLNWTTDGNVTVQVAGNTPFHFLMHTVADHPSWLLTMLADDTVLKFVYQFNGGPQSLSVTTQAAGTRTISLAGSSQAIFAAFSHCLSIAGPNSRLPLSCRPPGPARRLRPAPKALSRRPARKAT